MVFFLNYFAAAHNAMATVCGTTADCHLIVTFEILVVSPSIFKLLRFDTLVDCVRILSRLLFGFIFLFKLLDVFTLKCFHVCVHASITHVPIGSRANRDSLGRLLREVKRECESSLEMLYYGHKIMKVH